MITPLVALRKRARSRYNLHDLPIPKKQKQSNGQYSSPRNTSILFSYNTTSSPDTVAFTDKMGFVEEHEIEEIMADDESSFTNTDEMSLDYDEQADGTEEVTTLQPKLPFSQRANAFVSLGDYEFQKIENYFFSLLSKSGLSIDEILEGTFDDHEVMLITPQEGPPDVVRFQMRNAYRYRENLETRFKGHTETLAFKMACLYFGLPVEPLRAGTMPFDSSPGPDLQETDVTLKSNPLQFLEAYGTENELTDGADILGLRGGSGEVDIKQEDIKQEDIEDWMMDDISVEGDPVPMDFDRNSEDFEQPGIGGLHEPINRQGDNHPWLKNIIQPDAEAIKLREEIMKKTFKRMPNNPFKAASKTPKTPIPPKTPSPPKASAPPKTSASPETAASTKAGETTAEPTGINQDALNYAFRNSKNTPTEARRAQELRDRTFTEATSIFTNPLKPVMPLNGPPLESIIKTGPSMPGVSIAMMTPTEMLRLQQEVHSLRFQLLDRTRVCPYADCDRYFTFSDGEGLDRHIREEHNILRCYFCDKNADLLPYYDTDKIKEHFVAEHLADILKIGNMQLVDAQPSSPEAKAEEGSDEEVDAAEEPLEDSG
ncbi:hypothetical protein NPX13_g10669 [Xylaria arbuscula]|uniref:Uncharacterized protein n=1 Tax=Xylaria arbuscula TaxID=114810 RepID=A0A9W8THP5_9PEZI|nr:hypothetical protein NPX13_g10669 [Xylaria arbuscula]